MLINDHFQNYKVYQIPKAQLIIADIPYSYPKLLIILDFISIFALIIFLNH